MNSTPLILVIDDSADIRQLFSLYIQSFGYRYCMAENGGQGLAQCADEQPDVILLDVLLPDMSGYDVCRSLKQHDDTALIPVVMVTALDAREDRIRGLEAGADEFLSKPIVKEELQARLTSLIALQQTRRKLEQSRIEIQRQKLENIEKLFSRYVSPAVARQIVGLSESEQISLLEVSERKEAVVLFVDIRHFTPFSETVASTQVVNHLNDFFTLMTDSVFKHRGTSFSILGDSLMAGFGVPFDASDKEQMAFSCAVVMLQHGLPMMHELAKQYDVDLGLGVGLNIGEVVLGNVGSANHMSYTMIGDTVNVAARLQALAASGEIVIAKTLADKIDLSSHEHSDEVVSLKGKRTPLSVKRVKIELQELK